MGGPSKATKAATSSPSNSQHTVSDDDEIDNSVKPEFYDSEVDDKDEIWVSSKRKGQYSDAVLSCPACFTTLCFECQRHDVYLTQYRAIFVVNCKITNKQVLPQTSSSQKRKRQGTKRQPAPAEGSSQTDAAIRQVCCDVCSTDVGVIDEEEVYHFYDVIPSEC
ncbi:E2F-associated phosphoprotein-like protein [Drosera capensis]